LVISMLALFVAISGVASAGKIVIKVPANSITSAQIKDGTIRARDLANSSVTTTKLARGSVTAPVLASNSVYSDAIAPEAVQSSELAPGSVTTGALGSGTVTGEKIATSTIGGQNIQSGAIGTVQIGDSAVALQNIQNGAVTAAKLAEDSVTTNSLTDGAVTLDKIQWFPGAQASASGVTMNVPPFPGSDCSLRDPGVSFDSTSWNRFGVFDEANPGRLVATVPGVYSISVNGTWAAGAGRLRVLQVIRRDENENGGTLKVVSTPPVSGEKTHQSLTFQTKLNTGDRISLRPATCGAVVELEDVSMSVDWVSEA
jgi:hypothetical protein